MRRLQVSGWLIILSDKLLRDVEYVRERPRSNPAFSRFLKADHHHNLFQDSLQSLWPTCVVFLFLGVTIDEPLCGALHQVLVQPAISSQLVDNLNASIHLRALLTYLFLVDEPLKTRRQSDLVAIPFGR